MKTILVFASTLDGKTTKWENPFVRVWASQEDQKYFHELWDGNRLIIIGSNTYNAEPIKPSSRNLVIVMTGKPELYREHEVRGQLEFSDKTPVQLTEEFKKEGYEQMMVVGGEGIATSFLKEKLIDELWLTIEPKIFGKGKSIVNEKLDIDLRLISCQQVNKKGTLINKYGILK